MSKHRISLCLGPIVILSMVTSLKAKAFDPTGIASGLSAGSGILGGSSQMDSLADIGFSVVDLLSELDLEPSEEQGTDDTVKRLEDLNDKARDLRWSNEEIKESLQMDLHSANSLQQKIRALKNMIEASKKIAALMQIRPKAGDQVSHIQEIKVNSMMLEELQAMHRETALRQINEDMQGAQREMYVQEILKKERSQ